MFVVLNHLMYIRRRERSKNTTVLVFVQAPPDAASYYQDEPRPQGRFAPETQQVVEVLQEGDGYDGSAFVADLLSIGGPHEEEAQVRSALPSAT